MPIDDHRAANRANWDDRVPIHWGPDGYNAERFIAEPERISDVVRYDHRVVGDVAGKRLLHLQCHFGMDTLSWARLGAEVTGVDFSEPAIEAAQRLSAESGTPGRFILSELYDAPNVLHESFDMVYTGIGAICWLPDIAGWARVVAGFVEPGGTFYIREGHPVLWSLEERADELLVVRYPYFEVPEPIVWDDDATYAGSGTVASTRTYEWNHGIGEILTALTDAGLHIEAFREHRDAEWQALPHMELGDDGLWRLPPHQRDLVPLSFTIRATKPA